MMSDSCQELGTRLHRVRILLSRHKKAHSLTALDSFLRVTGAPQGEKKCIFLSCLWVSHDRSVLRIDMLLANTGLLTVKKKSMDRWVFQGGEVQTMKDDRADQDRGKDETTQKGNKNR